MSSFFLKNETPVANGVDVKRLARKYIASLYDLHGLEISMDQALDHVSSLLGARNYHDLLKQASDPDISSWDASTLQNHVWREAISSGSRFPSRLPRGFRKHWQDRALKLFEKAASIRIPSKLEFIALVGGEGAGKTLLSNHLAKTLSGKNVDICLSLNTGMSYEYQIGSVLIYDQPAPSSAPAPRQNTLAAYKHERYKSYAPRIPRDEPYDDVRQWVKNNPHVHFVVCFASMNDAVDALENSRILMNMQGIKHSAELNWYRAHVINLDDMTLESYNGPGFDIEQGQYEKYLNI